MTDNWLDNYRTSSAAPQPQDDNNWLSKYKSDPNQPNVIQQEPKQQISTYEDIIKQQPTVAAQTLAGVATLPANTLDLGARIAVQAGNYLTGGNAQWPGIMNLPGEAYSMATGKSNPLPNMPSTSGELLSKIGEDTGTTKYIARQPETLGGNLANVGEQFVGMGAAGGTKIAGTASETALNSLKTIPTSLGAAAGTEAANQLGWGPIGQLAGGLVGAATPEMAVQGASKIKSPIGPITETGQKQAAIKNVMANTSNPQELAQQAQISAANQNPSGESSPIAPQVNPTAAEMVPADQRLANYQNQTLQEAKKIGDPAFVERVQTMNNARNDAINQFVDSIKNNGNQEDVGQLFTSHLNAINEQQRAAEAGQNAIKSRLLPNQSLEDAGIQATESYEQARNEAVKQRDNAYAALDPLRPQMVNVGDIPSVAKNLAEKSNSGLYNGNESALKIENEIYTKAKNLPNTNVPFGFLIDAHKSVNSAISDAIKASGFNAKSPPVERLYQLKNSVESAINNAIDQNQDPVHQTIKNWLTDLYSNHTEGQVSNEQSITARNGQTQNTTAPTKISSSPNETTGVEGIQFGNNENSGRVSPGEQFKTARQANVNLKETFDNPKILSNTFAKQNGEYTKSEATRGAQLFKSGTEGGQNIENLISANVPREAIEDSALHKLRSDNILRGDDGDADRLQRWQIKHESALSKLPELKEKLNNASNAFETLSKQAENAQNSKKQLLASSASKFLENADPIKAVKSIIEKENGIKNANDVMRRIGNDEQAKNGIKSAVIDHLQNKFGSDPKNATEMLNYLQKNKQTITRLLGDEKTFNDIVRIARIKMSDAKNGVGSLGELKTKTSPKQSIFGKLHDKFGDVGEIVAGGGAVHALSHVPLVGKIAAGTILVGRSIKSAGYKNIKQFEREIMLNPGNYPELFQKYAKEQDIPVSVARKLSQKILSNVPAMSIYQSEEKNR